MLVIENGPAFMLVLELSASAQTLHLVVSDGSNTTFIVRWMVSADQATESGSRTARGLRRCRFGTHFKPLHIDPN